MTVQSLGSGSSGNATIISTGRTTVAIDCGVGSRALAMALRNAGLGLADLDAVLLSHEHADHVRSLPSLIQRGCLIVSTAGTARAARVPGALWEEITIARGVVIGDIAVTMIPVAHDAAEPCGFHLSACGERATVVTDIGTASDELRDYLACSDLVILEANHDEEMVRLGPYPEQLKRRILSAHGHLSNSAAASLLVAALRNGQQAPHVWLAHLSTTNNGPKLAQSTVTTALRLAGCPSIVEPLPRRSPSPIWSANRETPPRQLTLRWEP